VNGLIERHPVVAIVGTRQVGKTTLAHQVAAGFAGRTTAFDLENPAHLARLNDPLLALEPLRGLIVIDEIQRRPNLFSVLRVLADRPRAEARFLVLGSASPDLLRQSAESLAGRIAYYELAGFTLDETDPSRSDGLWLRGGFPRSFLAESDQASMEWRREFIGAFLERDLPQLGLNLSSATLRRFWTMLAHSHGQIWNASDLARSFGVADTTVRRYLDVLTSAYVVRQIAPWHENLRKRQVKSPKIYLCDSGLLHALLNLPAMEDLESHPKSGSSWEGWALAQVTARLGARSDEIYFWATHAGAELDLLVVRGRRRFGFELKRTSSPQVTRSMRTAFSDLKLDRLDVIYAGEHTFPLAPHIRAVPVTALWHDVDTLD
jgi:predicted AAA+ superfamily ATPase